MIKIPEINDTLKIEYKKDTFKSLKNFLVTVASDADYTKIITFLSTNGELDDKKIESMLLGDIYYLRSAIQQIGQITDGRIKEKFGKLYKKFTRRKLGTQWAEKVGVKICPYCNRNYIFTLKGSNVRPQYDHYFPKSLYPYLALSMYNLIPCCAICNGAKHDFDTYDSTNLEENFLYPYRDSYGKLFNFRIDDGNNISSWLGMADEYKLIIAPASGVPLSLLKRQLNAAKKLNLIELYNKHSDFVRDVIRTAYIYNDEYYQSLLDSYPSLFSSVSEAKNFVYLNYIDEPDWDKRILAKLTHDIIEECKAD